MHRLLFTAVIVACKSRRARRYIPHSTECYVLAMIYIDRVLQRHPGFAVSVMPNPYAYPMPMMNPYGTINPLSERGL